MSRKWANVKIQNIFNNQIAKAQIQCQKQAQDIYTQSYLPKMKDCYNIALDPLGKQLDSFKFSKLICSHNKVNFFIGGAYGFNKQFLSSCDAVLSLSSLTFAHKVANIVLCEQIFRALCIDHNHPYHK